MSYGSSITGANRQVGFYTGRILRGNKTEEGTASDLLAIQSPQLDLMIDLKPAEASA